MCLRIKHVDNIFLIAIGFVRPGIISNEFSINGICTIGIDIVFACIHYLIEASL